VSYSFQIDPATGSASIGNLIKIVPGQDRLDIEQPVSSLIAGTQDHRNGYQWLYLKGLSFGSQPCGLGLCFFEGKLHEISWSVNLLDAPMEGGWPTRAAVGQEIKFVRSELERQLGCLPELANFTWGQVWSEFDQKGFTASNRIRYTPKHETGNSGDTLLN
jgi:hypothetical protein